MFYGIFVVAITSGIRGLLIGPKDQEESLLMPLTISLVSFFVIKSIYSGVENQSTVFMMLGAVSALVYRIKLANTAAKVSPASSALLPFRLQRADTGADRTYIEGRVPGFGGDPVMALKRKPSSSDHGSPGRRGRESDVPV